MEPCDEDNRLINGMVSSVLKKNGLITLLVLVFCQTREIGPALLKPDKTGPSVIIFVALLVLPISSKNADVADF